MNRRTVLVLVALAALALGLACLSTKIGDIQKDPRKYEGKEVSVSGTVTDTLNILVYKAFILDDGSGQIRVITERILPAKGSKVTVTGTVEPGLSFGKDTSVVLREKAVQSP